MLNEVTVEGFVTSKIWRYREDLFFRLASHRDPGRPEKTGAPGQNNIPDFITIRVPGGMIGGVPYSPRRGEQLRIYGWLASEDDTMTLGDFVRQLRDEDREALESAVELGDDELRRRIIAYRLDVVPQRVVVLGNGKRDREKEENN
jgi:hypothetical protein